MFRGPSECGLQYPVYYHARDDYRRCRADVAQKRAHPFIKMYHVSYVFSDIFNYHANLTLKLAIFALMEIKSQLTMFLEQSIRDMKDIASSGEMSLDQQVRAYDLMSYLMDGNVPDPQEKASAHEFADVYADLEANLTGAYDETALKNAVAARLAPLERACTDMRFEAASAASLHEFAKETFHTWQTAGIFMRKRALKALRERAGFKLESHRIGNYVAKTFDLMNEAQMRFARAQQAVFASDVTYKVQPGLFGKIADILR